MPPYSFFAAGARNRVVFHVSASSFFPCYVRNRRFRKINLRLKRIDIPPYPRGFMRWWTTTRNVSDSEFYQQVSEWMGIRHAPFFSSPTLSTFSPSRDESVVFRDRSSYLFRNMLGNLSWRIELALPHRGISRQLEVESLLAS